MTIFKERFTAYAKINLFLGVCGKRQDGYHLLSTLMQSVSLCDYVTVECSDSAIVDKLEPGISLMTNVEYIPLDARNTAYKAARAFLNTLGRQNVSVRIHIQKGIPTQAGMGGGSADAAAVLNALASIFPGAASKGDLLAMAVRIGADVPFCIDGGTQLCEGIGDILTPVLPLQGLPLLFIKPKCSIPTPWAFTVYDSLPDAGPFSPEREEAIKGLLYPSEGTDSLDRIKKAAPYLYNDLERVTENEYPVLSEIRAFMMEQGAAAARMSGSGSTVFGIFADKKTRDAALENAFMYRRQGCFVQAGEMI